MGTRKSTRTWRDLIAALLAVACLAPVAVAQDGPGGDGAPPDVPYDYLSPSRRLLGDVLRLCVYTEGLTAKLDLAVAQAVADALLLKPEIHEVTHFIKIPGYDAIPISEADLYVYLHNHCDAFLGFTLGPDIYDPWLTVTRPYVTTRFIAVTMDPELQRLGDLPSGAVVGTVMVSEGDVSVGAYLNSLPEERRWRRFPYPYAPVLIERLADGTVAAAVGWEPAFWFSYEIHGVQPREIPGDPVAMPTRDVGMVLRSDQLYVRDAIDAAIAELAADGTLQRIYEEVGFPGTVPR